MRGKAEFKTMEFDESGICKNAQSDDIVSKDISQILNHSFVCKEPSVEEAYWAGEKRGAQHALDWADASEGAPAGTRWRKWGKDKSTHNRANADYEGFKKKFGKK